MNEHPAGPARFEVSRPSADTLALRLSGAWTVRGHLPAVGEVTTQIDATPAVRRITFDTKDLADWDSGLLTFILGLIRHAKAKDISSRSFGPAVGHARPDRSGDGGTAAGGDGGAADAPLLPAHLRRGDASTSPAAPAG